METLTGIPQKDSLSNPPDIFNTQYTRRRFLQLSGSRVAAGVAGYMAQRLGLLPLLSAEGPPEPERIFNNIEVITMSGNASGDRLACVFRDPLDSTIHAAWMRPDLANKRWVGEEIKLHPDIKILHGGRPISGGIEMSEDGKITVFFGYKGNREDRGGIEDYSNDGAFSFDGETLYTHPEMGEITSFKISTDNRYAFIVSRNKSKPTKIDNFLFDLNTKEIKRLNGDPTRLETRVRPTASGSTHTGYSTNLENDGYDLTGYTESMVDDGRIVNRTLHPEQGALELGMIDFQRPGKDRVVLAINNHTRNPKEQSVGTVFINRGTLSKTFQPNIEDVIRVVGGIPGGYGRESVYLTTSADFKGSDNAIVGVVLRVLRITDLENRFLVTVAGFSSDNPNVYGFYPSTGLPMLLPASWDVMRCIFTLRVNNTTIPVVTIDKIPYYFDPDAKTWQKGAVSLRKMSLP